MSSSETNQNEGRKRKSEPLFSLPPPSELLHKSLKYSPLLIGWDDDKFRKVVEEYRKKREEATDGTADGQGKIVDIEQTGFGLQNIINDATREFIYKRDGLDDLKSDLQKFEVTRSASKGSSITHENQRSEDEFNLRDMKLYQKLLGSVKYQRDAYFMGTAHAEERRRTRASQEKQSDTSLAFPFGPISTEKVTYLDHLNRNPTLPQITMASTQLIKLAQWFVPGPVMHNALLPTILWTITPPMTPPHYLSQGGPLRKQAVRASSDLIPLSQPLLDRAMKNSITWVLTNSNWRDSIKGSTRGLVGRLQEDDEADVAAENGRFVTTKTINMKNKV